MNARGLEVRLLALLGVGCTLSPTAEPDAIDGGDLLTGVPTAPATVPDDAVVQQFTGSIRVLRDPYTWSDVVLGVDAAPEGAEIWVLAGRAKGSGSIRGVPVALEAPTIVGRITSSEASFEVRGPHGQPALQGEVLYFQAVSADGSWSTPVEQRAVELIPLECGPALTVEAWTVGWGDLSRVVVCDTNPVPGYCAPGADVGIDASLLQAVGMALPDGIQAGDACHEPGATSACCYNVELVWGWDTGNWDTGGWNTGGGWSGGRPFSVDGEHRTSQVRSLGATVEAGACPEAVRGALVHGWLQLGLEEHASVAAFARFTLELLQLGAPLELIQEASAAQLDEVRHTKLAFDLASRFAGEQLAAEGLSMQGALEGRDLRTVTLDVVREGCINETVSTLIAMEARDAALDAGAHAAHTMITADETRHAELAWKFVRWALDQPGTAGLRAEVLGILRAFAPTVTSAELPDADVLAHYGVLTPHRRERAGLRAASVIQRCTEALAACG